MFDVEKVTFGAARETRTLMDIVYWLGTKPLN